MREASPAEVSRLAEIARLSPEAENWTEADLLASLQEPTRQCLVAECERQVAGFLVALRPTLDEAEILTLAVDPALRRRGVASALLRLFLGAGCGRVSLEVRVSNTAAQRLYQRFGFAASGIRQAYYTSPTEDAIVMQLICL
ncbi:MAG TPA: ribosomal protein S18-alanine N-acetyltransferase [Bryobacterales bacterium]|nr:ribosomal protein S18-alanine N-acetyltransferase [Bryobacterales bacterium]